MDGFNLPSSTLLNFFLDINVFLSTKCELKRFLFFHCLFFFFLPQKNKQQTAQWLDMVEASKDFSLGLGLPAI